MKEVGSIDDGTVQQATAHKSCFRLASIRSPHRARWFRAGGNGWVRNPGQSGRMRSVDFGYRRTIHRLSVGIVRNRRVLMCVLSFRRHLLCVTPGNRVNDSRCPANASAQTVANACRKCRSCRRITGTRHGCKPLECEDRRRRLSELNTAVGKWGSESGAPVTAGRAIGWLVIRDSDLRKAVP